MCVCLCVTTNFRVIIRPQCLSPSRQTSNHPPISGLLITPLYPPLIASVVLASLRLPSLLRLPISPRLSLQVHTPQFGVQAVHCFPLINSLLDCDMTSKLEKSKNPAVEVAETLHSIL
jgi:hypothetical protein